MAKQYSNPQFELVLNNNRKFFFASGGVTTPTVIDFNPSSQIQPPIFNDPEPIVVN